MNMNLLLAYLGTLQSIWSLKFKPLFITYWHQNIQYLRDWTSILPKWWTKHHVTATATLTAIYTAIQREWRIKAAHTTCFLNSEFSFTLSYSNTLHDRHSQVLAQSIFKLQFAHSWIKYPTGLNRRAAGQSVQWLQMFAGLKTMPTVGKKKKKKVLPRSWKSSQNQKGLIAGTLAFIHCLGSPAPAATSR